MQLTHAKMANIAGYSAPAAPMPEQVPAQDKRVLSVQSHVVHGCVGNRSAIFPLQLLGFEVDFVNSVQFSNHTGYPSVNGQKLSGAQLRDLVEGLDGNGLLSYTHLLTGYIGTEEFLREIISLRRKCPDARYVCDPVLGDNGHLYVSEALIPIYREEVVPIADVLTPNSFEAEHLTGSKINSLADAMAACEALHAKGAGIVVITSLDFMQTPDQVAILLSPHVGQTKWLLRLPMIEGGPFTGTGDLTAAMCLAKMDAYPDELPLAIEKVGAVLQGVLRETMKPLAPGREGKTIKGKWVPPELRLVHSREYIERPRIEHRCRLCTPLEIVGVIFGLDDLSSAVEGAADDLKRVLSLLEDRKTRVGLVSNKAANEAIEALRFAGIADASAFDDVFTIDSQTAGTLIQECCQGWDAAPGSVLVVASSGNLIKAAKSVGCHTVAATWGELTSTNEAEFAISSLGSVERFF